MVTSGDVNNSKPFKVYPEAFEKRVGALLMQNIKRELRTDGQVAYVVTDIDLLIISVMELYGEIQNKGLGEKKGV